MVLPRGYVGAPSIYDHVVDPSGARVVDPDGYLVAFWNGTSPGHVAGYLPFITALIQISRPEIALNFTMGHAATPHAAFSIVAPTLEETLDLTISDVGYRTDETPVVAYPPFLTSGLTLDARIPISPAQTGIVWGWGGLSIINADRRYDGLLDECNIEGRPVTIKYGVKYWDDESGTFVDPHESGLQTIFVGVAASWVLSEFTLDIALRDASLLIQKPLQSSLYAGTGTYEGGAELTGLPKPVALGAPLNVPLTLVDPANRIYQYNDGPGRVVALYEGGAGTIAFGSNTADLYSGSTLSGEYRTDNSRGLLQLGTAPSDGVALTADVIGHFPIAGEQRNWATVARYLLTEILGVSTDYIDVDSFAAAASAYAYDGGWFFAPADRVDGVTALHRVMSSAGAQIVPSREGKLQCLVLKAVQDVDTPVAALATADISRMVPRPLAQDVTPAVWRVQCAYQHNYTVQSATGLLGAATEAQRQFVQSADRLATWSDGAVQLAYANAVDMPAFGGGLSDAADALEVATRVGALFGRRRWLFDIEVSLPTGKDLEFGDVITVEYPLFAAQTTARARIVGRSFDAGSMTMTLTVLI
jgi:hypothetical protein